MLAFNTVRYYTKMVGRHGVRRVSRFLANVVKTGIIEMNWQSFRK